MVIYMSSLEIVLSGHSLKYLLNPWVFLELLPTCLIIVYLAASGFVFVCVYFFFFFGEGGWVFYW